MARIDVTLDEVLEAIDDKVGQRGRSRFLEEAARENLERIELVEVTAGVGAGLTTKTLAAEDITRRQHVPDLRGEIAHQLLGAGALLLGDALQERERAPRLDAAR